MRKTNIPVMLPCVVSVWYYFRLKVVRSSLVRLYTSVQNIHVRNVELLAVTSMQRWRRLIHNLVLSPDGQVVYDDRFIFGSCAGFSTCTLNLTTISAVTVTKPVLSILRIFLSELTANELKVKFRGCNGFYSSVNVPLSSSSVFGDTWYSTHRLDTEQYTVLPYNVKKVCFCCLTVTITKDLFVNVNDSKHIVKIINSWKIKHCIYWLFLLFM